MNSQRKPISAIHLALHQSPTNHDEGVGQGLQLLSSEDALPKESSGLLLIRTKQAPSCSSAYSRYLAGNSTEYHSRTMFGEASLDSYTDDELRALIEESPSLITTREETVRILSPTLVAKPSFRPFDPLDEVYAMDAARSTGVNVPEVHRVVPAKGKSWIVMDRVQGSTVEQLWPNIGIWSTVRIAWQLRAAIRTYSALTSQTTGGLHSGNAQSEWLQGIYGPVLHASPAAFTNYLNWWLTDHPVWDPDPRPELFLSPAKEHVLVHQDLAPRNMIVDDNGKLWIVDWGYAGFYPAYMEVMRMEARNRAMEWICENTWAAWWGRLRWSLLRSIAWGLTGKLEKTFLAIYIVHDRSVMNKLAKSPYSKDVTYCSNF